MMTDMFSHMRERELLEETSDNFSELLRFSAITKIDIFPTDLLEKIRENNAEKTQNFCKFDTFQLR